jgi:DNA polymerase-3 subunit delta'
LIQHFIEGQKALELLKNDVKMNTVRQGYIFEGAEGIGKKTAARIFVETMMCTGEKKPCGVCNSCAMLKAGNHPDVFFIDDSPVKIDSIRKMNEELFIKPMITDRKVFVIENADDMNNPAQNALLKSFEEPPSYAVIILIASSVQNLLPTILSRGTKILFEPFSTERMERFITEKYSVTGDRAHFVAAYSSGLPGRAEAIMESEDFFRKRDSVINAVTLLSQDKASIYPVLDAFKAHGRKMPNDTDLYFDIFIGVFRDVAVLKSGGEMLNSDYREKIQAFSSKIRAASSRRVIDVASSVKSRLNTSMKYDLWITDMLINCWEEIYGTGNRS